MQKRIKFLKRENEELKEKELDADENSEEIREQNAGIKKKNRELKVLLS